MSNLKKNLLALSLALMVLLAGFFSMLGGTVAVRATENNTYPPYQDGKPEKVVYINDNDDKYLTEIGDCLQALNWLDVQVETVTITADNIINEFSTPELYAITNSAVILELRNISLNEFYPICAEWKWIKFIPETFEEKILSNLKAALEAWKNNGCRVMFINHTEETLLVEQDREFFSDWDIHINSDIFTLFSDTILSKIEQEGWVQNCTILLDTPNNEHKYENGFVQFLFHCLRHTNGYQERLYGMAEEREENVGQYDLRIDDNIFNVLDQLNIQILTYDEYCENLEDIMTAAGNIIAVGLSSFGSSFISWTEFLDAQMKEQAAAFPVYCYREEGLSNDEREAFNELPQHFSACGSGGHMQNHLPEVLLDFLSGADLSQYINWDGKCPVTHKTVEFGSGGWLNSYCRIHDPEIEDERLS